MKKKPSDYFEAHIMQNDKKVSTAYGTYCGFLDFDGVRYWDGRYVQGIKIKFNKNPLPSDFKNRSDLMTLRKGEIAQAQIEKEKGEEIQRRDAKLRHQHKIQKN